MHASSNMLRWKSSLVVSMDLSHPTTPRRFPATPLCIHRLRNKRLVVCCSLHRWPPSKLNNSYLLKLLTQTFFMLKKPTHWWQQRVEHIFSWKLQFFLEIWSFCALLFVNQLALKFKWIVFRSIHNLTILNTTAQWNFNSLGQTKQPMVCA